jgi:hypothetical protein
METPKTQSRKELVSKVFDLMGDNFTSGEFLREMIAAGADANRMYLYNYLDFLKKNCERESKKTWTKKKVSTYSATILAGGSTGLATTIGAGGTGHLFLPRPAGSQFELSPSLDPQKGHYLIKSVTPEGLEQEAIDFLKSKGYKILKTTTVEL